MKKLFSLILLLLLCFWSGCNNKTEPTINDDIPIIDDFENYGMPEITIKLNTIQIYENGYYTSKETVATYIYTYHKLPANYYKKSEFNRNNYTPENKISVGGDVFYNREALLPSKQGRIYYECDIDYMGTSRNAKRIVYSNDYLIFYTDNHYESFSIMRFI